MPKTAKTIFHTTEKSNFILNMTPESYHSYNLKILLGFWILMPLFSMVLEFVKMYSVPGMALSIAGVFAMVFVFIGFMKSETPKQLFLPTGILGAMVLWGLVSFYNSYFYSVSLLGADGRSEGLLSLVFYGCFFLLAAQLGTDDNRLKLLHGMICLGLAECFWSLLQMLPIGFPSYYQNLEPILLFHVFLPSGLTGSPVFLAFFLNILLVLALTEAIFTEDSKWKIIDLIAVVCFSLTAVRTQCLIGFVGAGLALIVALIIVLVQKAGTKAVSRLLAAVVGIALGMGWNFVSPSLNHTYSNDTNVTVTNSISCYDGAVFWKDSAYRLSVSGYYIKNDEKNPNGSFDISDLADTYGYLWKSTLNIIKKYPLAGSGPDNLIYPQLYRSLIVSQNLNTFDRCNNFYLQIAGTMGIPMLLLILALMILVCVRGGKACREQKNWLHSSIFGAFVLCLLMLFLTSGNITVSPLFWILAGMSISFAIPADLKQHEHLSAETEFQCCFPQKPV